MTTHVFCILDRSGSMVSISKATINGYNEYVDNLRKQNNIRFNLTLFDHEIINVIDDEYIGEVPRLTRKTFVPRGSTALIDAVCATLNQVKRSVPRKDKALVIIITDGMENSSSKYSTNDMKSLVEKLQGRNNWTFTYLGANQDAWDTAQKWGFSQNNVSDFMATGHGVTNVFSVASANTGAFARSSMMNSKAFYSTEDKEKLSNG